MIKLAEMTKQMRKTVGLNRPRPFSLVYVTFDRKRKTGGQFREIRHAILLTKRHAESRMVLIQPVGLKAVIPVHLDLIIYFNDVPVA
jgi:hypothetical protein